MELINNQFIKLKKLDIYTELVKAVDEENISMQNFFNKLSNIVFDYEKELKENIDEVFIYNDVFSDDQLLNIPIKRQTLLNSYVYANLNGDEAKAKEISEFLEKREVLSSELGDLSSYILEYGMDMNEYFGGEKIRFVYNNKQNKIEKRFVYWNITKHLELKKQLLELKKQL